MVFEKQCDLHTVYIEYEKGFSSFIQCTLCLKKTTRTHDEITMVLLPL